MKKIKLGLITTTLITVPMVICVSCSQKQKSFIEKPFTIHSESELINFDMLREADAKDQLEADAQPGRRIISTNVQTKGSAGDLLSEKVLSNGHNTFYLDLIDKRNHKSITKQKIKLNKKELFSLSAFLTKILLEGPQNQEKKRFLPLEISHDRKEIIRILNEYVKWRSFSWKNIFSEFPKQIDINDAKKHSYKITNLDDLLVVKKIKKWRRKALLINTTPDKNKAIWESKNTWFILDPNYLPRTNGSGKVLKKPIGLNRWELEIFADFWTEFRTFPLTSNLTTLTLPKELKNNRNELIEMMNKLKDHNHYNLKVIDF
ncbi:MAG: hypothetical protein GY679_03680 [Mycoplasma sp.]|nr:hypothetical protein [Mycoplasma sp.]